MKTAALVLILAGLLPALGSAEGPQEDPRVRDLIERLSDDEIRVREKAASDLVDLGRDALPALQRLSQSGDIEQRARAASVLQRISEGEVVGRHWKRGARITLVSDGATVTELLEDLERQAKDSFLYDPADLREPVVLAVKDVPFWEAVEALCRAAPSLTWEADGASLRFLRKPRPAYPNRRQGEFTVWLESIIFNRDFDFTGNARSTFSMTLLSAWEAGIAPVAIEQKITEVLDEDGTNLMAHDRFASYGARLEIPKGRVRREPAHGVLPQGAAGPKMFSKVKGHAVFYFPRAYQEVNFDLQTSTAPVQLDRLTLALRNFRILKDACAMEVILTTGTTTGEPVIDRLPVTEIVLIDDLGGEHRAPNSSRSQSYSGTSYTTHENLQIPFPEGRTAKRLRLRLLKAVMEKRVPFEFADIPVE